MNALRKTWGYLRARLDERSTWMLFGAAVSAAAALEWPWSLIFCVIGVIGALVPNPKTDGEGGQ